MIDVGWLTPAQDCWDTNLLRLLLDGDLYPHGLEVRHHAGYPNVNAPVITVVPGRYYAQRTNEINTAIQRYASVLMVVTSDEESLFDIGRIIHPAVRFWVQTPRLSREYDARLIPLGFPPHFNDLPAVEKTTDVFLSAQRTHARRVQCFEALANSRHAADIHPTEGFTQGMKPAEYVEVMCAARVAPCPSGAVSPDSFRAWEALEAHCVPIADDISPAYDSRGYWRRLFPDCPFPIIENYSDLPGYIEDALADYPRNANRIAAWWIAQKRAMALNLREDLQNLGAL